MADPNPGTGTPTVPLIVLTLWGAVAVAAALRWFRWRP